MTQHPSMDTELNSRLDELFEDGPVLEEKASGSPLESLKAAILEMEWEIGEKTLTTYLIEVTKLKTAFSEDKAFSVYTKLLETIWRYLMAQRAGAHPETVSFLKKLYDDFERVSSPDVSLAERNRSAMVQANAFKQFKVLIASLKAPAAPKSVAVPDGISDELKSYIRQVVREEIVRLVKHK